MSLRGDVEVTELAAPGVEVLEVPARDALEGATVVSVGRALPAPVTDLGDLADVDLVPVHDEPSALVRDPQTGIFRNVALSQAVPGGRGSSVFYVETAPTEPPAGAHVGDYVHVIAGDLAGTVYQVQEGSS